MSISRTIILQKQTQVNIDFSYKLTFSNTSLLYFGIKAGGNSYRSDPEGLNSYTAFDPLKKALSRFKTPTLELVRTLRAKPFGFLPPYLVCLNQKEMMMSS